MKPIAHVIFSPIKLFAACYSRYTISEIFTIQLSVKSLFLILCLFIFSPSKSNGQSTAHGPSVKVGCSTFETFSFGLGYNFVKFQDDWGWSRPAHNYYIEYLPEYNALGLSANLQYTLIFVKAGFEASFRSKNENNQAYFSFYPHLGFDLINGDLSFGPEIVTHSSRDKYVGFKISLKVHPKLFNKGTNSLKFKKD
ncbi:MAG: hypothetical protein K0S23_739 [Fluviicola sp.]|jgi:hypothetical protein|uniref:hypothetical protein n=1 Tax=Fluviicola sp. TaxID=1917219 RepID=UPI00262A5195|nr:hypothetical protein [Fluviicola sp.]MDF3026432.1 hypothetical protein [Fluviicola sp.]